MVIVSHDQYEEADSEEQLITGRCGSDSNNKTSDIQTMMHVLKANIGTGVLAMPNAFKNVGLWLGFFLVPIIGSICIHCMHILISSHNRLCDRFNYESLDYDQVAALALAIGPKCSRRYANLAQTVITSFLMFTQFGFCCVYIMFVIENIQLAMFNLFMVHLSTSTYMMILFPVIGLTSCISNLKHLSIISTIANALQLTGLSLIFADLFQWHHQSDSLLQSEMQTLTINSTNEATYLLMSNNENLIAPTLVHGVSQDLLGGLPLFFATAVYAFEGIGVILPLVKEMERPELFPGFNGVLNTSMMLVGLLYMAMGYFGYLKYGQFINGSITINLPKTTLNEFVRLMFAMAIGLSYSLQFYVPWTIMWPWIDERLFYAYRPRAPRDKLDLMGKIKEINSTETTARQQQKSRRRQDGNEEQNDDNDEPGGSSPNSSGGTISNNNNNNNNNNDADTGDGGHSEATGSPDAQSARRRFAVPESMNNSFAATLATSYMMSTTVSNSHHHYQYNQNCHQYQEQQQQHPHNQSSDPYQSAHWVSYQLGETLNDNEANNGNNSNNPINNNNPIILSTTVDHRHPSPGKSGQPSGKVMRNRFEDVIDDESTSSARSMPDVKWRPPPRSMRGKRKLVRYTVILLFVALTFVAAALIPRLDLFISLIGALASSSLAIIFPPIIQMTTFWHDDESQNHLGHYEPGKRCRGLFIFKNILLILFGVLGLITGTFISVLEIIRTYSLNSSMAT